MGLHPGTNMRLRLLPALDPCMSLETTDFIVIGTPMHFNQKTRLLMTDNGTEILLHVNQMEKTRFLKDRTKQWLSALTK